MPPRNRLFRDLPFDARLELCALKVDGCTNEEVREALRARYPVIDDIGDNSYTAYLAGEEYADYVRSRTAAGSEVRQLRTLYAALGADADPTQAVGKLARFEAAKALRAALADPEADVPRISAALAQLARVEADAATAKAQARIAELEAQLAAALGERAAKPAADPALVQAELDRKLGVKPLALPGGAA